MRDLRAALRTGSGFLSPSVVWTHRCGFARMRASRPEPFRRQWCAARLGNSHWSLHASVARGAGRLGDLGNAVARHMATWSRGKCGSHPSAALYNQQLPQRAAAPFLRGPCTAACTRAGAMNKESLAVAASSSPLVIVWIDCCSCVRLRQWMPSSVAKRVNLPDNSRCLAGRGGMSTLGNHKLPHQNQNKSHEDAR